MRLRNVYLSCALSNMNSYLNFSDLLNVFETRDYAQSSEVGRRHGCRSAGSTVAFHEEHECWRTAGILQDDCRNGRRCTDITLLAMSDEEKALLARAIEGMDIEAR